ncbi:beta-lactamase family protein [Lepidopterella palustris CBS 459.81]|uniref:Beta-lactamase family protein n=1 Tax=Lepidopterella palustris CBS 459.81 TaxID=1314670 RepID=A0A8E2EDZ7_9PEZI|nr:beta-lactamase family protein [Lepidopterella palustris CBS 459.81]
MSKLSAQAVKNLQQKVEEACADAREGIPGTTVVVVGRDGQELFASATGKRGCESSEPMTLQNIYWIASCTKMVVGVACMQLVEQGKLKLDDAAQVESLCPELKDVKVLQADGSLVEKKRGITLRMLLSHTAGFGYAFFNERLRDYSRPVGYDEFSGNIYDMLQPLLHQPGEGWEYGINIDWAGVLLERVTGLSLNAYLHRYIFEPLGIKNMSMFPTKSMKENLAYMNFRNSNGVVTGYDHILRAPLLDKSGGEDGSCFHSGGAGLFAKPQEYCQILAVLLNDGTSATTGAKILQKATVDEMFRNQIPEFPNFARQGIPPAKPHLTNPIPEIYPVPGDGPQGWGLTFMLTGGSTGRSAGTAHWAGLPNLWWWCDREKGVAGIICTQILPFVDLPVLKLWAGVETAIYEALA